MIQPKKRACSHFYAFLPFGAGMVFYTALVLLFWNYTVDDSYISYRYAENLAAGRGLTFNPGERVEGYSNLLWILLLCLPARLGFSPVGASKALGLVSGWALLLFIHRWKGRNLPSSEPLIWISALASSLPVSVWAASGMETVFYTLLITAGLLGMGPGRRSPIFCLALGLAAITRPEGILFAAMGGLFLLYRREEKRRLLISCLMLIAPFLLQMSFRKCYYGTWLTNTFHAKMGFSPEIWIKGGVYGLDFFTSWGPLAVLWFLAIAGAVQLWRKDRPLLSKVVLAIVVQGGFIVAAGGDWMKPFRFWVPVLPFLFLLLAEGFVWLRARAMERGFRRGALVDALMIAFVVAGNGWTWPAVRGYTKAYSEGMQRTSVALGRWLAENARPEDWVALGDAGALPYYSGLRAIDLYGLMNPAIARLPGPALYSEGIDTGAILARRPNYVVLESHEETRFEGIKPVDRKLFVEPGFQSEYGLIQKARFSPREVTWLFQRREGEAGHD
jgi:hypothetical protein